MTKLTDISKILREFGIAGCHVRSRNIIAFSTQKWIEDDAMVPRRTMLFFYYPDEEEAKQWAAREWDLMTGIHGCACFEPSERWVFIADPGEVYVVGQGDEGSEKPITSQRAAQFSAVKCIAGGHAYAVGSGRDVRKRVAPNKWIRISDPALLKSIPKEIDKAGFEDIDGFSECDLYACGGQGDLWWFDGTKWIDQHSPTDASLEKIVCADDGNVYVTTNGSMLLIGRENQWRSVEIDIGDQMFQEIVCYGSRVLASTDETVFDITDGSVRPVNFGLPTMTTYTHLAAGDGILVIAGDSEAFLYDGKQWKMIFQV